MPSFSIDRTPDLYGLSKTNSWRLKNNFIVSNFDMMKLRICENVKWDYKSFIWLNHMLLLLMYKFVDTTNQSLDAIQHTHKYD